MTGTAIQASSGPNMRPGLHHQLHHHAGGHHYPGSINSGPNNHTQDEEEGVDVVGLDPSDTSYSHQSN